MLIGQFLKARSMKTPFTRVALIGMAILAGTAFANAADTEIGDLQIVAPAIRATLPNQPVAGGFLTITNTGTEADRLVGGSADFADDVQVHEMGVENDVMKMRQMAEGLEIPAGGSVELKPGGYHLMFMKINEPMKDGEIRKVKLMFEKAGSVDIEFDVRTMRPGMDDMDHDHDHDHDHKDNKQDHSEMKRDHKG